MKGRIPGCEPPHSRWLRLHSLPPLIPSGLAQGGFTPKTVQVGNSHMSGCLAFNKIYDLNLVLLTPSLQASKGNKNVEAFYSFPSSQGDPHTGPKPVRGCVNPECKHAHACTHTHTHTLLGRGGTFTKTSCVSVPGKFPEHPLSLQYRDSSEAAAPALDAESLPPSREVGRSLISQLRGTEGNPMTLRT